MNLTQTETSDPPSDLRVVEFYPSVDDYVHITAHVTRQLKSPLTIQYAYQVILFINAIGFPAFLWFGNYYLWGFLILAVNLAALAWLIPWFTRDSYREYYKQVIGPRENEIARTELDSEGIRYYSERGDTFLRWRYVTEIEETDDAIFFYFLGNGFAVRKNGFAYREEQEAFVAFARSNLKAAHAPQLEQ